MLVINNEDVVSQPPTTWSQTRFQSLLKLEEIW
jgi:hypothetical protein